MLPNLGNIQKQVQKMQADMTRIQGELENEKLETSSGGGMVKVTTTGAGEVLEIKIAPEVVDPNDVQMLEDLVVTAVRDALNKTNEHRAEKMGAVTGGIKIPGMPF